jgi:apolipoprotein N-acyltransferase
MKSPVEPLRRPWVASVLLAVGGGGAFGLCFGKQTSLWLPWLALVPLMLLLGRPRAGLWGWLHGVAFWMVAMAWLPPTLVTHGGLPPVLGWTGLLLVALYLGFDQAVFAVLGARIWRRGGVVALLALPALWVVLEWWRGFFFGRFPWNLAAYAWVDVPGALPVSASIGAFGVSFVVVFANVAVASAIRSRRWEPAAVGVLAPLLLLVLAGRFSPEMETAGDRAREVRVVQPSSPIVTTAEEAAESYRTLIEMSEAECRASASGAAVPPGPRPAAAETLLVWPESAAWPWSYDRAEHLRADVARLSDMGCALLIGSVTGDEERYFNSAMLISAGAPTGVYSKRRLVPWGEYVPLAGVLPWMDKLARQAGNFSPGGSPALLPWGDDEIGTAICYEIVFPGAVAEQVRAGATILATITNDAWYGDTAAPWQHMRAARFRAAENRRPVLRAALTGVSVLVDGRGAVAGELGVGERGVLRARISGSSELTPFSRAPSLVLWVCVLLAGFAVVRDPRRQVRFRPDVGEER